MANVGDKVSVGDREGVVVRALAIPEGLELIVRVPDENAPRPVDPGPLVAKHALILDGHGNVPSGSTEYDEHPDLDELDGSEDAHIAAVGSVHPALAEKRANEAEDEETRRENTASEGRLVDGQRTPEEVGIKPNEPKPTEAKPSAPKPSDTRKAGGSR